MKNTVACNRRWEAGRVQAHAATQQGCCKDKQAHAEDLAGWDTRVCRLKAG